MEQDKVKAMIDECNKKILYYTQEVEMYRKLLIDKRTVSVQLIMNEIERIEEEISLLNKQITEIEKIKEEEPKEENITLKSVYDWFQTEDEKHCCYSSLVMDNLFSVDFPNGLNIDSDCVVRVCDDIQQKKLSLDILDFNCPLKKIIDFDFEGKKIVFHALDSYSKDLYTKTYTIKKLETLFEQGFDIERNEKHYIYVWFKYEDLEVT